MLLRIIEGTLKTTQHGQQPINIVLDAGSQQSYLASRVAKNLPRADEYVDMLIHALGEDKEPRLYPRRNIEIKTMEGEYLPMTVIELKEILPPINTSQWHKGAAKFPDLPLRSYFHRHFPVDLLIGADELWRFDLDETRHSGSLQCQHTRLGWTIQGPLSKSSQQCQDISSLICTNPPDMKDIFPVKCPESTNEQRIDRMMKDFIASIMNEEEEARKENPEDILTNFHDQIKFENGRYIVPLLWRRHHPPLPTNLGLAKNWLNSLVKKLKSGNNLKEYHQEILRQVDEGVIEEVGKLSAENSSVGHHFLPHFAVSRPDHPTTKLRIVFAANTGKVPLNNCLQAGPSLIQSLLKLLVTFRINKVAFTGDLRKAFNSLEIRKIDRKFVQFLWYRDGEPTKEFVVYCHKMVGFGPNCCPFLLFATLMFHLLSIGTPEAKELVEKFYSDNLINGKSTAEEAIAFLLYAIEILAQGNFNLRDCRSNSEEVNIELKKINKLSAQTTMSVLGLTWDTDKDTLAFQPLKPIATTLTKRTVLRFSAGLYDPLGLLTYASAPCMSFITELWIKDYDWDTPLSTDLVEKWSTLEAHAVKASHTIIPRAHPFQKDLHINLCIFTDASETAASAIAYLQQGNQVAQVGGKFKIFNTSKTGMSIPKKELTGLVLGANLGNKLYEAYKDSYTQIKVHMLTDSEICLYWIFSPKKKETFVHNRVVQIKDKTENWMFHHVSSKENPSDLPTRGIAPEESHDPNLYEYGPPWLRKGVYPEQWTATSLPTEEVISLAATAEEVETARPSIYNLQPQLNIENFNDYNKLLKITGRLISAFKNIDQGRILSMAENIWIQHTQEKYLAQELAYLITPKGKPPPLVKSLRLFLYQGFICCRGRFANVQIPDAEKYPILLPRQARFTKLLVMAIHEAMMHLGSAQLMTIVRKRFWIPKVRSMTEALVKQCVKCAKVHAKAYQAPPPPDLPSLRVNLVRPYNSVGVDFTGAIYFKINDVTTKGYILITSCTVTRHVHLQLVPDMSAAGFIQALRYHAAIYGSMTHILCDNALGFVSSENQLNDIYDLVNAQETQEFYKLQRIKFKFIPKRSAWFGAHYERLIGIVKNHLKRSVGRNLLSQRELSICLAEIAAVMNERPLTAIMQNQDAPFL